MGNRRGGGGQAGAPGAEVGGGVGFCSLALLLFQVSESGTGSSGLLNESMLYRVASNRNQARRSASSIQISIRLVVA